MKKRWVFFFISFFVALVAFVVFDEELLNLKDRYLFTSMLNTGNAVGRTTPRSERTTPPSLHANVRMRLATFNIRVFTSNSRDDEELDRICDILQRYDIIAIQELRDVEVLERVKKNLQDRGKRYEYSVSKPVGTSTQKELYAFLYRAGRIIQIGMGITYYDPDDKFIREPYYATFKCENFDFTLITVHLLYKNKTAPERQIELTAIGDVFNSVQNQSKQENDIILTGDFNEEPDSPRFFRLREISDILFLVGGVKTTISDASTYDQIIFQKKYTSEYSGDWGVFKFDEEMFGNDDSVASRTVSDHRPVWADFITTNDDD